jgi:glyoxylase-like metal-dependent hydrolase (beta-lactamase superfamily II)
MRCLLIEEGNRLILVDNGIGNKQDEKFFGHYHLHGSDTLDGSLAALGFHRADITDVFLTHLHFDHCGGSITREGDRLVPAFKNATYWSNKRHWKWATEPNDREKASFLKENILPIQESGQLKFVETADPNVIIPGLSVRFVNGHTDAMMLPQLSYKGKTLVFMADLLPSKGHIPLPYVMAYDMFPLTTLQEKRAFFDEAIAGEYVLFFEHDHVNECCTLECTLERTEKGVRSGRTFRLDEL